MASKQHPPDRAPWPIRVYFGLGSFVHPKLVLRRAEQLFFRPVRFHSPQRQIQFEALVDSDAFLFEGVRIRLYRKPGPGARLLFVHGWSGRAAQFREFIEYFSDLGFDCTAFDAPGHGLSEDGPVDLLRIARIVAELSKKQGDFDAAVGHSLGGMALHLALSQGLKLQKLATVASPFSIPRVVAEFCSKIGAGQRLEQVLIQRLKQRYSERSDLFETEPWCARHKVPGLVVHDRDDADVSFEDALAYSEHWLGGQLLETRGLGHRKPLRDSAVIQALGKAFEEVTAPTFQIDRDSEL